MTPRNAPIAPSTTLMIPSHTATRMTICGWCMQARSLPQQELAALISSGYACWVCKPPRRARYHPFITRDASGHWMVQRGCLLYRYKKFLSNWSASQKTDRLVSGFLIFTTHLGGRSGFWSHTNPWAMSSWRLAKILISVSPCRPNAAAHSPQVYERSSFSLWLGDVISFYF